MAEKIDKPMRRLVAVILGAIVGAAVASCIFIYCTVVLREGTAGLEKLKVVYPLEFWAIVLVCTGVLGYIGRGDRDPTLEQQQQVTATLDAFHRYRTAGERPAGPMLVPAPVAVPSPVDVPPAVTWRIEPTSVPAAEVIAAVLPPVSVPAPPPPNPAEVVVLPAPTSGPVFVDPATLPEDVD